MKNEKICAFVSDGMSALPFGANEEEEDCIAMKERMMTKFRRLAAGGVRRFRIVMDEGPGLYASEAILALRKETAAAAGNAAAAGKEITLSCVIPCETLADRWQEALRDRFFSVMEQCDEEIMLSVVDTPSCRAYGMMFAADGADAVLALPDGNPDSRTACLLRLAQREGKETMTV